MCVLKYTNTIYILSARSVCLQLHRNTVNEVPFHRFTNRRILYGNNRRAIHNIAKKSYKTILINFVYVLLLTRYLLGNGNSSSFSFWTVVLSVFCFWRVQDLINHFYQYRRFKSLFTHLWITLFMRRVWLHAFKLINCIGYFIPHNTHALQSFL